MAYIMYVCPECRKVYKIEGHNKKARCTKCTDSYVKDMNETEEDWRTYNVSQKNEIIDGILEEPEIIEVEEVVEVPRSDDAYNSFFDFGDAKVTADKQPDDTLNLPVAKSSFFQDSYTTYDNDTTKVSTPHSRYISEDVSYTNVKEKKKDSKLSIIAAVLSIFGCTSIIGLIIAIIDLTTNKDDGKRHIGSWVCIVITSLFFIAVVATSGGRTSSSERSAGKKNEPKVSSTQDTAFNETNEVSEESSVDVSGAEDEDSWSIWGPDIPSDIPVSQANALRSAYSYLSHSAFSHDSLVEQLEYEGYPHDDCVYAADNCNADWNEQAMIAAQGYLRHSAFSYQGLVEQLLYEQFTEEQAEYGVDHCEADWNEQAEKSAKSYLSHSAFSYNGLVEQLEYENFTEEQAKYGVDHCEADWNEQAEKSAKGYLSHSSFSHSGLVEQLEYEGFTHEQAEHGVSSTGL